MKSSDKKLIAVLCSMIVLLVVMIGLAVSVYNNTPNTKSIEYIPGTTSANNSQTVQQTVDSAAVYNSTNPNSAGSVAPTQNAVQQNSQQNTQQNTQQNSQQVQSAVQQTTAVQSAINVSGMTSQQLLDTLASAINKTKAYTGNVTVSHVESFEANVTECTGGSIVKSVANTIVGMVINPVDEVLSFSGGKATNSENEVVPILLPQKGSFTLNMNGVKSISGTMNGNEAVIRVNLVPEVVDLYTVPTANASAIGYLDINSYDTSILEITSAKINYVGSSFEVHIRPDGYVSYAKYEMPMNVEGSAKSGSISGSAVFDGQQTEIWQFNW